MLAPPTSRARAGRSSDQRSPQGDQLGGDHRSPTTKVRPDQDCIPAELIGDNECRAVGLVVRSTTPVLAMCRQLIAAGVNPALPLECYRGTTLAITVASIGQGAGLKLNGHGSGFRAVYDGVAASPVRKSCQRQAGDVR